MHDMKAEGLHREGQTEINKLGMHEKPTMKSITNLKRKI